MAGIVAASREQATGISQVNETISQMDQSTQQNAALVEEAAAATTLLRARSDTLAGLMSVFTTQCEQPATPNTRPARHAPARSLLRAA